MKPHKVNAVSWKNAQRIFSAIRNRISDTSPGCWYPTVPRDGAEESVALSPRTHGSSGSHIPDVCIDLVNVSRHHMTLLDYFDRLRKETVVASSRTIAARPAPIPMPTFAPLEISFLVLLRVFVSNVWADSVWFP
jgi:hypothetical protein